MLELKVLKCDSVCHLICTFCKGFCWFFFAVTLQRFANRNFVFLPNNLTFAIKTDKTVSLLSTYKQNWSVFSAVKKIIAYYDNIYQKKNEGLVLQGSAKLCGCVETWVAWVKNLYGLSGLLKCKQPAQDKGTFDIVDTLLHKTLIQGHTVNSASNEQVRHVGIAH